MDYHTVQLSSNGLGAQVYLPRSLFRHSRAELSPGDRARVEVLEDGRIALGPPEEHDPPVDGTRRDTTGDADGGGVDK